MGSLFYLSQFVFFILGVYLFVVAVKLHQTKKQRYKGRERCRKESMNVRLWEKIDLKKEEKVTGTWNELQWQGKKRQWVERWSGRQSEWIKRSGLVFENACLLFLVSLALCLGCQSKKCQCINQLFMRIHYMTSPHWATNK